MSKLLNPIQAFLFRKWRSYIDRRFDRRFGVDTGGQIPAESLTGSPSANPYVGTPPARFFSMISALEVEPREVTFIDFGCGKGRVLLLASQLGFTRVIGLELSPELVRIARKNVETYQKKHPGSAIEVICEDAASFKIPAGNILLYMYNPFQEDVMRQVVANVDRAVRKEFRQITIVYYNARCAEVLDAAGFLERLSTTRRYSVYRSVQMQQSEARGAGK